MKNKITINLANYKYAYVLALAYLIICFGSLFPEIKHGRFASPSLIPVYLILILSILALFSPLVAGIIFLVFGLLSIFAITASGLPVFIVIVLLPLVLIGTLFVLRHDAKP